MNDRAAFWICSGEAYIRDACISAKTVKKHMPDLPLYLFTPDENAYATGFDKVIPLPERKYKHNWFLESTRYLSMVLPQLPEYLVWATADTYCCSPFDTIFSILQKYDIASTPQPAGTSGPTYTQVPDTFPELTICVVGLHNTPALQEFASLWYGHYREYQELYTSDQPSLRYMLHVTGKLKYFFMPSTWTAFLAVPNAFAGPVQFLHGRPGLKFLHQDEETMERYAREVNEQTGYRTWRAS